MYAPIRIARWLFYAVLLGYFVVALRPFHWQPPLVVENGAQLTPDEELRFARPGLVRSQLSPPWVAAAAESSQLELRLRFKTYTPSQTGPARIFSVSRDENARNLTIGQEQSDLIVRLRRGTAYDGRPYFVIPRVLSDAAWHQLEVVVNHDSLIIRWDEETVLVTTLPIEPLSRWNTRFPLVLGNELSGNRPWQGAISLAKVDVAGKQWDCLSPAAIETPSWYFAGLPGELLVPLAGPWSTHDAVGDLFSNLICFIPLGFLLAAGYRRLSIPAAVVLCALLSFSIEFAQIFFDGRYTSLADLAANTLGGGVGAVLARARWACERLPAAAGAPAAIY